MLLGNLVIFTCAQPGTIGTFSNNDESMDYDVYDRLRPGMGPSTTAGNTNT